MNDRPNDLLRIRPQIKKRSNLKQPVLTSAFKRNNPTNFAPEPLLLAIFHNYIEKRKGVFYDLEKKAGLHRE